MILLLLLLLLPAGGVCRAMANEREYRYVTWHNARNCWVAQRKGEYWGCGKMQEEAAKLSAKALGVTVQSLRLRGKPAKALDTKSRYKGIYFHITNRGSVGRVDGKNIVCAPGQDLAAQKLAKALQVSVDSLKLDQGRRHTPKTVSSHEARQWQWGP
jgi:hypothetical protein